MFLPTEGFRDITPEECPENVMQLRKFVAEHLSNQPCMTSDHAKYFVNSLSSGKLEELYKAILDALKENSSISLFRAVEISTD
jgi:hypothetical protein